MKTVRRGLSVLAFAFLLTGPVRAQGNNPRPPASPAESAADPLKTLSEAWPDRPEWLDMYTDILQGSQLGPNDGWFRRAVAQTRFGWDATRKQFDRDGDGKVARAEFPGEDADFARLDRDHDKALTRADFDFSAHALAPSPGAMIFQRADRDGNGKVTREEIDALFSQVDTDGHGFLSLSDLQESFRMPHALTSAYNGADK